MSHSADFVQRSVLNTVLSHTDTRKLRGGGGPMTNKTNYKPTKTLR